MRGGRVSVQGRGARSTPACLDPQAGERPDVRAAPGGDCTFLLERDAQLLALELDPRARRIEHNLARLGLEVRAGLTAAHAASGGMVAR